MKILVLAPINSPIVQRLIFSLEEAGNEIICASHNAEKFPSVINLGRVNSMFSYFDFFKIRKLVKIHQPDVVHAHIVNHYGLMGLFQPKPLVVALWGSDVMLAPNKGGELRRLFYGFVNYLVLLKATKFHTSAEHVAKEAIRQCKHSKNKGDIFYWGFPLLKPNKNKLSKIIKLFKSEFSLPDSKVIVFPRGLGDVYNPIAVANIINKLLSKKVDYQIVVLKGFANDVDVDKFSHLVDMSKITFIDRLLNQDELYYLYSKSSIHISIPKSDSLGGGVIEPALLGSFPVLSNLPSYQCYIENNNGLILNDFSGGSLSAFAEKVSEHSFFNSKTNIPRVDYSLDAIVKRFEGLYTAAINNHNEH